MAVAGRFVANEYFFQELSALNGDAERFGIKEKVALTDPDFRDQASLNNSLQVEIAHLDSDIAQIL